MNKEVILYPRVSTNSQSMYGHSLNHQKVEGLKLAKQLGYEEDQVYIISDEGVSTRKRELHERKGISDILQLIRTGNIKYLIVSDRDRLARKMVEHLKILEELKRYNVQLLFSAKGVPPHSDDYALEATLGLNAETEGNKINERTNYARKFYPNFIPGYITEGIGGDKRYKPKNDNELEKVKQVFISFQGVQTLEEFKIFQKQWKKYFKNGVKKLLENGFYAAYLIDGERFIPVTHIPPIVDLNTILENRRKFNDWGLNKERPKKISLIEQMNTKVSCSVCGDELSQKQVRGVFKYNCNHGIKNNKKRVSVPAKRVIDIVTQSIVDLCKSLDADVLKEVVSKNLRVQLESQKRIEKEIKLKRLNLESKIMKTFEKTTEINRLLQEDTDLESQLKYNLVKQNEIKLMIGDINNLVNEEFYKDIERITLNNLIQAGQLLIREIRIDQNQVHIIHLFKDELNEVLEVR